MSDSADPRERILLATLTLIERVGAEGLTTRAIAAEARVNLASINYYYRSKDLLVAEVLKSSLAHTLADVRAFFETFPEEPRRAIEALADYLLEGGLCYPRITRAHFLGLTGPEPSPSLADRSEAAQGFRDLIGEIADKVARAAGRTSDEALHFRTGALFASILYPSFLPEAFPSLSGSGAAARYRDILVESYFLGLDEGAGHG